MAPRRGTRRGMGRMWRTGVENRTETSGGKRPRPSMRWVVVAIVGGVAAAVGVWKGGPWVRDYFSHVSTDDAFVAGDATTVASRFADVVEKCSSITMITSSAGRFWSVSIDDRCRSRSTRCGRTCGRRS